MPYTKSTVSSRRRARTFVVDATSKDHRGVCTAVPPDETKRETDKCDTPPYPHVSSHIGSGFCHEAKKIRKESPTVHSQHEEELELSQELTSQCDAVALRVNALLDRAQLQEKHINQVLKESLERSPIRRQSISPLKTLMDNLSPQPKSASGTPKGNSTRWSGLLRTPQIPKAPPPTPARPDTTTGTAASSSVGWISKMLRRSPDVQLTPTSKSATSPVKQTDLQRSTSDARETLAKGTNNTTSPLPCVPTEQTSLLQRAFQRLSGRFSSPPPQAESPRRSRKSVAFKEPDDLTTVTPLKQKGKTNEPQEDGDPTPRGSLVYPPAPPPSAQKENSQRRSSGSLSNASAAGEEMFKSDGPDVETVIRKFAQARAMRELTKSDLVAYAKQHHITVNMSSSKKELFDVARSLAKGKLRETH